MYCYKWFCKHVLVRFFGLTTVTFTQTDYNYCKVVAGGNLVFFLCPHVLRREKDNLQILDLQTQLRYLHLLK